MCAAERSTECAMQRHRSTKSAAQTHNGQYEREESMSKKKRDMTPAQKAAARWNPDVPKPQEEKKKTNALGDENPLGGIGITIVLVIVIAAVIFAFCDLNNFFGLFD